VLKLLQAMIIAIAWVPVVMGGVQPGPGAAGGWRVRDDEGRTLTLPGPPQRIVSLSPGATAMLFAAGGGARVVGTPDFSVEPEAARSIARIGDSHGFDLERILALHPDLVIAWSGGAAPAQLAPLERAGLLIYRHRVVLLDDLPASIERLGALLHSEAVAGPAAAALRVRIAALRTRYARARPQRLLVQVWDRPVYTVGGAQLISDAIEACGYRNVFAELHTAAPAVALEAIAARDPDAILALAADARTAQEWLAHWRELPAMRAVRTGRLFSFVDDRLSRLGPEAVAATEALCARLAAGPPSAGRRREAIAP
jgi:iron complex transport system substrate-binding protein